MDLNGFRAQPRAFRAGVIALSVVSAWFAIFGAPALWALAVPATPVPLGIRLLGLAFVLTTSPALFLALVVQSRGAGAGLKLTGYALALAWLLFSAATFFLASLSPEAAWDPGLGVPALAGAALLLALWTDRP